MTRDEMKRQFHALGLQRDSLLDRSDAPRAVRDAINARIGKLERARKPLDAAIKTIEAPLFDIDMSRSGLSRALGGKTGVQPPRAKGNSMTAAEVETLLKSLKLDDLINVTMPAEVAPVIMPETTPDPRIPALQAQLDALSRQLAALPTAPMAPMVDDQTRENFEAISRDVATIAKAVQVHEEAISGIKESLGSFVELLKDAR